MKYWFASTAHRWRNRFCHWRAQSPHRFYDVYRIAGLTGKQGVLIPGSNVRHLVLRGDVIQAVAEGKFHIYPVRTIDDGLAILTSMPANGGAKERDVNLAVSARAYGCGSSVEELLVGAAADALR